MSEPVVVPAPAAPLAGGDPTRCCAVSDAAATRFPGLTRPEADAVAAWLGDVPMDARDRLLVPVELGVVLSGGAGPYLLDARGALVLVLAPHPAVEGTSVAMGAPVREGGPLHVVGVVSPSGSAWHWVARADVREGDRVAALDALDACADVHALDAWQAAGGLPPRTLGT